jgi:polysaccharide biosynthesis transport protein
VASTDLTGQAPSVTVLRNALRRRWLTIVVVALAVSGVAVGFSFAATPIYAASASVVVATPAESTQPPNMDTEKKIAGSSAVAELVRNNLAIGLDAKDLLRNLSVDVPVNTDILVISYDDPSASIAQQRAQAFADQYLAFRSDQLVGETKATEAALKAQIEQLGRQIHAVEQSATRVKNPAVTAAEAGSLTTLRTQLQQRLELMTPVSAITAGLVVDAATLPLAPAKPSHVTDAILGLLLGVCLGIMVAWMLERRDRSVRVPDDIEEIFETQVFGAIPSGDLVAGWSASDAHAEFRTTARAALGRLRTEVILSGARRRMRSIMVSSVEADPAPATAALAASLSRAGKTVVVVATDPDSALADLLGVRPAAGLAEVFAGAELRGVLQPAVGSGIEVLSPGAGTPATRELLASQAMLTLMNDLEGLADIVLIDVPSYLATTEAGVVAALCDAVVLVVGSDVERSELATLHQQLERQRGALLGVLAVDRRLNSSVDLPGPRAGRKVSKKPSAESGEEIAS